MRTQAWALVVLAAACGTRAPAPAREPLAAGDSAGTSQGAATGGEALVLARDGGDAAIASIATAPALARCAKLTPHTTKAKLLPLPPGVIAFGPDGYLAWEAHPGFPIELVTDKRRVVLASQKPSQPPWFPSNVHSAPGGRVVWSVPEGVFVHEAGKTRQLAGKGARSGVIVDDTVYYVKDDTVHAVDARGDRVVLRAGAHVDGKRVSSYVLRAGGGALGLQATAEDVKVGPSKGATVLGWIERGKLVDARILDIWIGAPDLHGDTYVYADNHSQSELYALERGNSPTLIFSTGTPIDGNLRLQSIHGAQWDGGPLFFETPSGIYRIDGCKLAAVAHELLAPTSSKLAKDAPEARMLGGELPHEKTPAEKPRVWTTILHANYGDAIAGDRAVVRHVEGGRVTSFLYVPL